MRGVRARPLSVILLIIIFLLIVALLYVWYWRPEAGQQLPPLSTTPSPGVGGNPAPLEPLAIEAPIPGADVSSPFELRGRAQRYPYDGRLVYRVFDGAGQLLGTGPFTVTSEAGQPISFTTQVSYTAQAAGPGRIEVVELSGSDGAILAGGQVTVTLSASGGEQPAQPQQIFIDTPPPDIQVGSPVVLTGRTAAFPNQGLLSYRVTDANGAQLGVGRLSVTGAAGQPSTFNASLTFNLPAAGGPIRVTLFDLDPAGAPIAEAGINLFVAPPPPQQQRIFIETPLPGTAVGSPLVVTGRTALFPAQGSLRYRITDAFNTELGNGNFAVTGAAGGPATFGPALTFRLPQNGGPIRVVLFEQPVQNGPIVASATIDLVVLPPQPQVTPTPLPQQISLTFPPPGTAVGSPMGIAGSTTRPPSGSQLGYQVFDAQRNQIGQGTFPVTVGPDNRGQFSGNYIVFSAPANGGPINVEIFDRDAAGNPTARQTLNVLVNPPGPPPPQQQQIFIDTPAPGTTVGSPVVVTGRTAFYPFEGSLSYRVRDAANTIIGQGAIQAQGEYGGPGSFNAQLTFNEPPGGGDILVEIVEQDQATGGDRARATVQLRVAPPPLPTDVPPPPPTDVPPAQQDIVIESPVDGTPVGSPVVVTGRVAIYPDGGSLSYLVLDATRNTIGEGTLPVNGAAGGPATFNAQLTFTEPPGGGRVVVEIFELNPATNTRVASDLVALVVNPQPQPRGVVPPDTAGSQQIVIDAPAPGSAVGSSFELFGRLERVPNGGQLYYRVQGTDNRELGAGTIAVQSGAESPISFVAPITYRPPAAGGAITVEVYEQAEGRTVADADVELVVAAS